MREKLSQYQKPLLAAGLLALLLVLYFYRHKIFKGTLLSGSTAAVNPGYNSSNTSTSTENTVLKKGSKGEQVRQLQLLLNEEHRKHTPTFIPLLEEDGVFGTKTEQMLVKYTSQSSISLAQLKTKLTKA
jgi:hypothetical protein